MLSTKIKEATKQPHQQLEGVVVRKLKAIDSDKDYAEFLKFFYAYFNAVENAIKPYITISVLPDYQERRNSSFIKKDIEALGENIDQLPEVEAPVITTVQEALGALYVLEGSIMGGSIIVKMLEKIGITRGTSFFSGYGEETGKKWSTFVNVLNKHATNAAAEEQAIKAAGSTFALFGKAFENAEVA
ncbi:biliverdin-producing heme oxygenase [Olivibacter sp. XZL3]|uniref:biliverdin-producing heme oxygenase n=1 Tax=Olivibacter sp. XZL3 TaxID=1735116 RepID=UPI001066D90B|nr:biliverdin-producing heme oxygenase [Olivibacter sp. XZL3]